MSWEMQSEREASPPWRGAPFVPSDRCCRVLAGQHGPYSRTPLDSKQSRTRFRMRCSITPRGPTRATPEETGHRGQ